MAFSSSPNSATLAPEWELESVGPDGRATAVPAHLYIQRVAAMHAQGQEGFAKEFDGIKAEREEESQDNKKKKRKNKQGIIDTLI